MKNDIDVLTLSLAKEYTDEHGGGGGGTSDYEELSHLPEINGVILKGNKSPADLSLATAEDISGIKDGTNIDSFGDVEAALANKVDKVSGKGLSENDYTDADKTIVDGVTTALAGKIDTTEKGASNGVAELDANGRVPSSQLPSYVDDVLEYASLSAFPATGETGKIYIALDTNKTYRWGGTEYVEISESLALGETSSTAYAGNKGKANADAIAAMKDGSSIDSFGDVETALSTKVDEVAGKGLSTNDYTNEDAEIVSGVTTALEGKQDALTIDNDGFINL